MGPSPNYLQNVEQNGVTERKYRKDIVKSMMTTYQDWSFLRVKP